MDTLEKIKRSIHYYNLQFDFLDDFNPIDGNQFREIFKIISDLAKTRANIRYQVFGEKAIFIQDVKFEPANKVILGKLRCIRKDILPEIMNTKTDETKGIEAKDEEGLVETTHFVIDFSKKQKKLAIEFNQFGAKIGDFIHYIQNIGINKSALKTVGFTPIVKDELSGLKERINRCSEFVVKVHKDNIEKIKSLDNNIYTALKASIDHFKSDYATLILKFDYREKQATPEINKSIFNIVRKLVKDKTKTELFNHLSVRAEDTEKNNILENFDLLIDKVKSEINVEKKKRYRTVVSADIYEKMKSELIKKHI
jgi:hypothetical protein